ncbi:MAG: hypothetical protein ACP5OR_07550 [Candidatus Dormibacteria bacterium]
MTALVKVNLVVGTVISSGTIASIVGMLILAALLVASYLSRRRPGGRDT